MVAIIQSFSHLFLKRFGAAILQNLCFPHCFLTGRIIERSIGPRPLNWITACRLGDA
jgi:hypothetical protein